MPKKQGPQKEQQQIEGAASERSVDADSETQNVGDSETVFAGALCWLVVVFLPPAAILWALSLPKKHPQKIVVLIAATVWFAVLIAGSPLFQELERREGASEIGRVPAASEPNESADVQTSESLTPSSAPPLPATTVGLGFGRDRVQEAFSSDQVTWRQVVPFEGQENMIGEMAKNLWTIQMVGPPTNLQSVSILVAMRSGSETDESETVRHLTTFVKELAPLAKNLVGSNLDRVSRGGVASAIHGNTEVTLSGFPLSSGPVVTLSVSSVDSHAEPTPKPARLHLYEGLTYQEVCDRLGKLSDGKKAPLATPKGELDQYLWNLEDGREIQATFLDDALTEWEVEGFKNIADSISL